MENHNLATIHHKLGMVPNCLSQGITLSPNKNRSDLEIEERCLHMWLQANPHMVPAGAQVVMDQPKGNWDTVALKRSHMNLSYHITRQVLACHMSNITMTSIDTTLDTCHLVCRDLMLPMVILKLLHLKTIKRLPLLKIGNK
jgi:hypothetical protein